MPAESLKEILWYVEQATLDENCLRPWVYKGCKEPNRDTMLEVLEFAVDEDPNGAIGDEREIGKNGEAMAARNLENGRRCRDLAVVKDINWEERGHYMVVVTDSKKMVTLTLGQERFVARRLSG